MFYRENGKLDVIPSIFDHDYDHDRKSDWVSLSHRDS